MLHAAGPIPFLLPAAGLLLLAVACLQDIAMRLVPNAVPLGIAALGAMARALEGDLGWALLAGFGVFAVAALCWRRGWLGGADVKLFGAGALLVPPAAVFGFVLVTCLAGGVLAILYVAIGCIAAPPSPIRPAGRLAAWSASNGDGCSGAARCHTRRRSPPARASCSSPVRADPCCFVSPCSD